MNTEKAAVAEIKARGQLTIPKKIREMSHIEEGRIVSIIPAGDGFIVTPRCLELDEAQREIRKVLKAANLSVEELLETLQEERDRLYQEIYGKTSFI